MDDKSIQPINTPIDSRLKPDPVEECIEYLRSYGDYYGVQLLEAFRVKKEKDSPHT